MTALGIACLVALALLIMMHSGAYDPSVGFEEDDLDLDQAFPDHEGFKMSWQRFRSTLSKS